MSTIARAAGSWSLPPDAPPLLDLYRRLYLVTDGAVTPLVGRALTDLGYDPTYSLRAWQEQEAYSFDLLSDFWPHGEIARAYGVFDEDRGVAIRGSFLIDSSGVLRWALVNPRTQARDLEAYRTALALL